MIIDQQQKAQKLLACSPWGLPQIIKLIGTSELMFFKFTIVNDTMIQFFNEPSGPMFLRFVNH